MNRNQFQVVSAEVIPVSNIVYDNNGNININATIASNINLNNIEIGKKRKRCAADMNVGVSSTNKKTKMN
jgi:hypothetical protein